MYQRRQSYSAVPPEGDPRRTEGWALTESARRLAEVQRNPEDETALLDAVRRNWRLWTIFQAGVMAPDSQMPTAVKANVLSLANFIDKHTVAILADPQVSKLDILIRINREIAAGLLAVPQGAAPAQPSDAASARTPAAPVSQSV